MISIVNFYKTTTTTLKSSLIAEYYIKEALENYKKNLYNAKTLEKKGAVLNGILSLYYEMDEKMRQPYTKDVEAIMLDSDEEAIVEFAKTHKNDFTLYAYLNSIMSDISKWQKTVSLALIYQLIDVKELEDNQNKETT